MIHINELTITYKNIILKLKKFLFDCRAKLIIGLAGNMPVIINCEIYDDVFEKNFGSAKSWFPCVSFNNKLHSFQKYAMKYAKEELGLATKGVSRSKSGAITLNLDRMSS